MLIRYKRANEKVAMGLLALMPQERQMKQLKQTMELYNENPYWQLFYWKVKDDYAGIIGVQIEDEEFFSVQHLSVIPSFRGEGIGTQLVEAVEKIMGNRQAKPSKATKEFLLNCKV